MEKLPYSEQVSLDTAVELSFDYLKQIGTISMTAAGGLVALAQFAKGDERFFTKVMIAIGILFFSALLAFFVQFSLMDRIKQSHPLLRKTDKQNYSNKSAKKLERIFESISLWALSIGMGVALQALVSAGVPA